MCDRPPRCMFIDGECVLYLLDNKIQIPRIYLTAKSSHGSRYTAPLIYF